MFEYLVVPLQLQRVGNDDERCRAEVHHLGRHRGSFCCNPGRAGCERNIFAAYASVKRIESFLLLEDKEEALVDDKVLEEKPQDSDFSPIKIVDGSFAWTSDSEAFLQDVNIDLDPGRLHLCIGPVASVRRFTHFYIDMP